MEMKLELVVIPVADVDRAKTFYEQAGFTVDVDHRAGENFRVVQVTPPGSACSVSFGTGISAAEPGSYKGLHLVVEDLPVARDGLVARGVDVSEPFYFGAEGQTTGLHPERSDYGTFASFDDPDGNTWLLQEVRSSRDG